MSDLHVPPSWQLDFSENQLVALAPEDGFVKALGRIENINRSACTVTVETPLSSLEAIDVMRLGDVGLDPGTYEDEPR